MKIQEGSWVELDVVVRDEGGVELESDEPGPWTYVHGAGELPPKLEAALGGLEAGMKRTLTLDPVDAFGDHNPDGIVVVPRADFPPDAEIVPGDWVVVEVEDEDDPENHGEIEMRVVELSPDGVVLDANHPLAGRRLTFELAVRSVREAAPEDEESAEPAG